jgi:hypothetical protein
MIRMRPVSGGVIWLSCALAIAGFLLVANVAAGQTPGRPPSRPNPPKAPTGPERPSADAPPGVLHCRIVKFELADADKDKDVSAFLSVRPLVRKYKQLRLAIPKGKEVHIALAGKDLEEGLWKDFPWKGLLC